MGFFDDLFRDIGLESSRNHASSDVNPYYVYLMQNEYDDIVSIYKVPYSQSSNGGWRLNDFISDNIKDEAKSPALPEYKFRSYYVPKGSVLPEVRKDNLNTIWKLLDKQQLGILEKEIDLKNAMYADSCGQPFFRPDGTAFSGKHHNVEGWNEFIEKDNRKNIIANFEELKSSIGEIETGQFNTLYEMNRLIHTANQYKGLVPRLYDSLQNTGSSESKQKTARLLQKWLFPAFFVTNFGKYKWTDKDMLKFIAQTGIDVIRHLSDLHAMRDFFKRHGIAEIINSYQQSLSSLQENILNHSRAGEGRDCTEDLALKADKELKHLCSRLLNEPTGYNVPKQTPNSATQPPPVISTPKSGFRSWEEQNQSPSLSESKLDHLSFAPSIKY